MSITDNPGQLALTPEHTYQMNRVLRHKLRNHSAGLKMTLHRIQEVLESVNSQMADRCSLMLNELESLENFTERMDLIFSDLPEAEPMMLFNLICDLRRSFASDFPMVNLDFVGEECAAMFPNGNYILIALQELLANAGEAAGLEGNVSLQWKLEDKVEFTITNNGESIPENIPMTPPVPFYTEKGRHDGLGLSIADRICRSLNGTLSIESQKNGGVVVTLELPRKELSDG
ncbi:MAG: sensor histidine kinase [Lentisphaeraceae bacterium]|nr:sensor histidine kinase [Lentisphaeraceae bacterium]